MLIGKNPLNEAPDWFVKNIENRPEECSVSVNGAEIKYFVWGDRSKKPLLLLHGYNAHSHWWDHIAPALTESHCVVALDFSGMGESARREEYSQEIFVEDVKGVIDDLAWSACTCIAHSMGGSIATLATSTYPDFFEHLILLDSMIVIPPNVAERMASNRPSARMVVASPDLETAMARFRLTPPQPCKDYVLRHIAETSYVEKSDGWHLKSDPLIPNTYKYNDLHDSFTKINCELDYVYGQASQLVTKEVLEYMTYVGNMDEKNIHCLSGAMHHLFLDMPEEFIALIKDLITK
tara:strand:- start:6616 stop:7494 length:879 start_codon:yes stop_codon:yes gene_type:complete